MKYLNLIARYKYPIMVGLFFLTVALCLLFVLQGLRKDHSLDMVRQELKLKEESRIHIEQLRQTYEKEIQERDMSIYALRIRDSLVQSNIEILNNQINNLSKRYNEKAKVINSLGSTDLLEYFNKLPAQPNNDY